MSLVDTTFGPLPGPLIAKWGQPAVFVQQDSTAYNPDTGAVVPTETRTNVKIVITRLDVTEVSGLYQQTDVKIMIDPGQIADHYIGVDDWFEVPTAGGTQIMKVIEPRTYRGEEPVFFIIIARPQ
jgi:hypothetical protein